MKINTKIKVILLLLPVIILAVIFIPQKINSPAEIDYQKSKDSNISVINY